MKKKVLYVLTAVLLVVAMAATTACGSSGSKSKSDSSEDESWKYIEDNGKIIVGLDDTFAPMGFRDENNDLVGFDIDLAKAVGEKLGVDVEFKSIDWDSKEAELKSKKIDVIWNGMSATPDRQKNMTLTKKYFANKILVMSMDQSINVKSSEELKDMNVGTQAGSAALEAIQGDENYDDFKDNVKEYKDYATALLDMKAGRIDVVVIDEVYALYNNKNNTKLYESDFNFGADYYAIGCRKGDEALAKKLNGALQECLDDGTSAKICQKWFGQDDLVILEGYNK